MTRWKNNKTGEFYSLIAQAIDCTNSRDGTPVVIYSPEHEPHRIFVREVGEFEAKFTQVEIAIDERQKGGSA